jgi:hypothetical protein
MSERKGLVELPKFGRPVRLIRLTDALGQINGTAIVVTDAVIRSLWTGQEAFEKVMRDLLVSFKLTAGSIS